MPFASDLAAFRLCSRLPFTCDLACPSPVISLTFHLCSRLPFACDLACLSPVFLLPFASVLACLSPVFSLPVASVLASLSSLRPRLSLRHCDTNRAGRSCAGQHHALERGGSLSRQPEVTTQRLAHSLAAACETDAAERLAAALVYLQPPQECLTSADRFAQPSSSSPGAPAAACRHDLTAALQLPVDCGAAVSSQSRFGRRASARTRSAHSSPSGPTVRAQPSDTCSDTCYACRCPSLAFHLGLPH